MYISLIAKLLPTYLLLQGPLALASASESPDSAETIPTLITLGDIDGESTDKMSIVTIRLDQSPSWKKLEALQNHGAFMQLTLPGTIVPEPGKFYDGGNPYFPKVGAFQITPSDAAIRLFTASAYDATTLRKAVKTELLGSRLVVTIDPALISAPGKAPVDSDMGPPRLSGEVTADDVIAKTTVRQNIARPSEVVQGKASSPTLTSHLTRLATGGAFLTVLMLLSIAVKPLLRRRRAHATKGDPAMALKTLASLPLAPRQKVSVIQVGNERILLGLTPDAITFLTVLPSETETAKTAVKAQNPHESLGKLPPMAPSPGPATTALRATKPRMDPKDFSDLMTDEGPTLGLEPAPRLKKIPGNDEDTLRSRFRDAAADEMPARSPKHAPAARGKRINISVGEDGVKNVPQPQPRPKAGPPAQEAIDDVTRLIREKLKNLKSI